MTSAPRALVIGASETAELIHLPHLARLRDGGRVELVEICDLRFGSAAAAQRKFGFERHGGDSGAAIAREDIDLVYVFGGARMHYALGHAAISAGKHLFVEKPIAPTYAEAIGLADLARECGVVAVGGHNRRFLPSFGRVRAEAGQAGWTFAEARFHKPELGRPPPFGAASWLSGNGIHALDALVYMMGGLPEWVSAEASGLGAAPSIFTATMRWANGAHAVLLCNNEAGSRTEEYVFHSPGVTWTLKETEIAVDRDGAGTRLRPPAAGDGFDAEHEAFLDAVATGTPPRHSLEALAPSLFLAELIEAGHHGPVRLPVVSAIAPGAASKRLVLFANIHRMRGALGQFPVHWQLVCPEEIERSTEPRPDITAAIIGPGPPASAQTLDKLPNLEVVGVVGLSLQRHGVDRLLERGITVVNASKAYAESVAEFALGLAILARRRAFGSNAAMHTGGWGTSAPATGGGEAVARIARSLRPLATKLGIEAALRRLRRASPTLARLSAAAPHPSRDLRGAVVGLIGWGANARAFTQRLIAAGAHVIVHSEHGSPGDIRAAGAEPAPLASVLAADIVSLHRGLTPETRHCLGAVELARLRPGSALINVARGALIDSDALVARLRRGDIVACLDTFDEEPLPPRHPLRGMSNVFLTSHIAGGSPDMHAAAAAEVIGKVARLLDGKRVEAITAERLATMT